MGWRFVVRHMGEHEPLRCFCVRPYPRPVSFYALTAQLIHLAFFTVIPDHNDLY